MVGADNIIHGFGSVDARCALIGTSLNFAVPNYGPAFGRSYLHVASDECMLVDMIWVCPGSSESNLGHDSEGSACATCE